jgi:hypothetical protein
MCENKEKWCVEALLNALFFKNYPNVLVGTNVHVLCNRTCLMCQPNCCAIYLFIFALLLKEGVALICLYGAWNCSCRNMHFSI